MTEKNKFTDQAHVLIVQQHQLKSAQDQLGCLQSTLDTLDGELDRNQNILDSLFVQAQTIINENEIIFEIDEEDTFLIEKTLYVYKNEIKETHQQLGKLDNIEITESTDWEQYLDKVENYAVRHDIDFGHDPFQNLMSTSQRIALEKRIKEDFSLKNSHCDKYDYMIAGTCGLIGGLIDITFAFIELPKEKGDVTKRGALTNFADEAIDKAIQRFASFNGWPGSKKDSDPTNSAIAFLEKKFKVNYDQTTTNGKNGTGGLINNLSTKNHHIKSLGHSPDIVGLFFSILGQFTNKAYFVGNGKIIAIDTETFELKGNNFISKVFSGFVNWLGHLFSDMAGSSGAIGRGSGIPIPFFSLLQFINIGEFGQHKQTFATIAVKVFEEGYDFRHGIALAIPVMVTELLTRIMWTVKQRAYHKKPWDECVPSDNNPELKRMLLIAHGSLCLVDTTDATLRSGGDMISFMLRSNFIAWARFGTLALKELKVWYREGDLDIEAVDSYLDTEYVRLFENSPMKP